MTEENQVVEKPKTEVAVLQQNQWVTDEADREDVKFPRAKIYQGTATEAEQYPDGKPGMILNHITGEEISTPFVPFLKFKQYAKFNPRNPKEEGFDNSREPGALLWMTTDSTDPRVKECQFGADGSKPTAVEFMNFMSVFEGQDYPIIVPFAKTSLKAGKKLFSMLVFSGRGFTRKYNLVTKKCQKDGNTYYCYDVMPAGASEKAEAEKAAMFHKQFKPKTADIAQEETNWEE